MPTINSRFVMVSVLGLGLICGFVLRQAADVSWAQEPSGIQPAVAEPALTRRGGTMTPGDHLRRAAEHLEAAGEVNLAQHVRQLASRPDRSPTTHRGGANGSSDRIAPWSGASVSPAPARLPAPSPLWKMQVELPEELDDGNLRFVQPARNQAETREVRAVPAPQRDPI